MNSFLTPIKEFQKNKFIFTQPQKENIINLSRLCMIYLHNKYNIYIYDLMQNEKNWLKWKENACPQVEKMKNLEEKKYKEEMNLKITDADMTIKLNNYKINFINQDSKFINDIDNLKETKINDLKFTSTIEGLNSEVPFFGTYLEQVYKDLDSDEEEENIKEKERIFNKDHSFTWKYLRLLSEGNLSKINTDEINKLLMISEEYFKKYSIEDINVKLNFKTIPHLPTIELKPKEEICLPKEFLDTNIINNNENKDKDKYKNRPYRNYKRK